MARIIFLTDFSEAYARGLLLGIARYAHDTGQAWSLCRLPLSIRDKFGIASTPMALVVIGKADESPACRGHYDESRVKIL